MPPGNSSRSEVRILVPFLLLWSLAACESSAPAAPDHEERLSATVELTVDAAEDWTFVSLGAAPSQVEVSAPASSSAWDLGFFATSVMLNGGDAGPGEVAAHCVCQSEGLSDAEVMALTDEEGLTAFEAVGEEELPATEDGWVADTLVAAIDGWYSYDPQTHVVSASQEAVWKVRAADGDSFAKLHVVAIESPTREHAGTVTLEFAVQEAAGEAMGSDRTLEVDLSQGGSVRVHLETGQVTEDADAWDLWIEGYTIRVNGGVSGDGQAGAVRVDETYAEMTDASDLSAGHYGGDSYGGVFSAAVSGRRWYRYNLEGQHQIWPTYNVFLVQRGSDVFKVQITGYYSETGDPRHVTFRFAPLGG